MSFQIKNLVVADRLKLLVNLLTLHGESIWKIKAYNKALDLVLGLDIPVSSIKDFERYDGIGKSTAKVIRQIMESGTCDVLESLRNRYPNAESALALTSVPGVGIKKAVGFYNKGIFTIEDLAKACEDGRVSNKAIQNGIKLALNSRGRLPINEVLPVMGPLLQELREQPEVIRAEFAGSVRRGSETVKDVDIIVVSSDREKTNQFFQTFGQELIAGFDKSRVMVPVDGSTLVQADLLFADPSSFGSSLCYFTGSKEHNISMRKLAATRGMLLNEHGLWNASGEYLAGREEEDIYKTLNIPWHPPELREGYDLLEEIPNLINREQIWSDWHMHSTWSADAKATVDEMVCAAKNRGLRTIGITDHVEVNYGWNPDGVSDRILEIRAAANKYGIKVFAAAEVGINQDGSLIDRIPLDKQDYLIASIHRGHSNNPVERLIKAIEHPNVKFIGHPTGRILGRREIPEDSWEDLFRACASRGVSLEINGARMDLPVSYIKTAKSFGCKFVLNSDAHNTNQLVWQDYSVTLARRAGLTKDDLIPQDDFIVAPELVI